MINIIVIITHRPRPYKTLKSLFIYFLEFFIPKLHLTKKLAQFHTTQPANAVGDKKVKIKCGKLYMLGKRAFRWKG